jgi:sugar phosphate isomerase/epimerase
MEIGIFSSTFTRPSLSETLNAVEAAGMRSVQFNLSCAGLPAMPDQIEPAVATAIRQEFAARTIHMAAVSGTFNIIHPNPAERAAGMRRLRVLAASCEALGTTTITIASGTRNPHNMWHGHAENSSAEAWQEMLAAMHQIAAIGAEFGVTMAFEPEVNNVVDSAQRSRLLLDQVQSAYLKVVIDGANIFHTGELPHMQAILTEAFALLGTDIVLAHAKDLDHDGDAGHLPAGHGLLDYPHYLGLLQQSGYTGPLILHGLTEAQVAGCIQFLQQHLNRSLTT